MDSHPWSVCVWLDFSTCSRAFYRYLECWGLGAHPHPWTEMRAWAMALPQTGTQPQCALQNPEGGKLSHLPVCTVKEARLECNRLSLGTDI